MKPIAGSTKRSTKFIKVTGIPYYCTSLYCALQILCFFFFFLPIEGLWQPYVKQFIRCHFSNTICSFHASVSHFDNSLNISNFSIIIRFVWWSVISDLWCYYCDLLKAQMIPFFSSKIIKVWLRYEHFFKHNANAHLTAYSVI